MTEEKGSSVLRACQIAPLSRAAYYGHVLGGGGMLR